MVRTGSVTIILLCAVSAHVVHGQDSDPAAAPFEKHRAALLGDDEHARRAAEDALLAVGLAARPWVRQLTAPSGTTQRRSLAWLGEALATVPAPRGDGLGIYLELEVGKTPELWPLGPDEMATSLFVNLVQLDRDRTTALGTTDANMPEIFDLRHLTWRQGDGAWQEFRRLSGQPDPRDQSPEDRDAPPRPVVLGPRDRCYGTVDLEVRSTLRGGLELLVKMGDDRGRAHAAEPVAVPVGRLSLRYRLVSPHGEGAEMPQGWSWSGELEGVCHVEVCASAPAKGVFHNESAK